MYSTGGIADRFAKLVAGVEERVDGPLPAAVRFWDGSEVGPGDSGPAEDTIVVRDPRALQYAVMRPDQLGIGRAWVAGDVDLEGDLYRVMSKGSRLYGFQFTLGEKIRAFLAAVSLGAIKIPPPKPPEVEARPSGRLHSLGRDREVISHHYDVSNDFYRMFLGPSMVYSCAYFTDPDDTLEQAQERKLDVICRKLHLEPGERMLDIGCGWGSLLIHAARNYGVRGVGVTLSEEQAEYARAAIRSAGLSDSLEVRVQDYREVSDGPYDKVVSVGMFEHVGASQLDRYMEVTRNLVRPGGLALHHGICQIHEDEEMPNTFIEHYVFPDGELHPVNQVIAALEGSGQELRDAESMREHYALTLRHWVANLESRREDAIAEVGEERERVWRLYMAASALAFERGDVSIFQLLAAVPGDRHQLDLARPTFVAEGFEATTAGTN